MRILRLSFVVMMLTVLFSSCQKEYSVEGSGEKVPAGTWQFMDSTKLFHGDLDTAYIDETNPTKTLNLVGHNVANDAFFSLTLFSTSAFKVGTYKTTLAEADFAYFNISKTLYEANQIVGDVSVTVTVLGNSLVSGTFSGVALDSAGNSRNITLGKFSASIVLTGSTGGTAVGTLGTTAGTCTPTSLSGSYTQGVALTPANTVQVQVNLTTAGNYTISTNTVNGVTFSGTGTFTGTGPQNVVLTGTGTPVNSGLQNYTVTFGTSACNFSVNYAGGAGSASGTLGATAGACTPVTPSGTYTQGIAITSSNTVQVTANVTNAGTYTISTPIVNGVSFSKSGTFPATGIQTVTLDGTGTPISSGAQTFTVSFGSSTCTFSITFGAGSTPTGDYFPTTLNSNWVYYYTGSGFTDSFTTKIISYTPTLGGQMYQSLAYFDLPVTTTATDTEYYRKPGGSYYTYGDVGSAFGFDNPQFGEFIFLKDDAASTVGTTFQSPTFNGTIGGSNISAYLKSTILAKGASVTLGSLTFPDVIKVKTDLYYILTPGGPAVANGSYEAWYARGVGLIYYDDGSFVWTIKRYTVF